MDAARAVAPILLGLALLAATGPCRGADAPVSGGHLAPETGQAAGVAVSGSGASVVLTAQQLADLPAVLVKVSFGTEHGSRQASYEGPLLWTILGRAGAIDPNKPRDNVRQTVLITGQDGYTAILALGEISPAFEGKQVILAERMDGQPLAEEHLRIVVPGDQRGGRSVRDVVRIAVMQPGAPSP